MEFSHCWVYNLRSIGPLSPCIIIGGFQFMAWRSQRLPAVSEAWPMQFDVFSASQSERVRF